MKPDRSELKQRLTPEQYHVTQEKGTERAFTGKYWDTKKDGIYKCIVCGEPLDPDAVESEVDTSHGMRREEVHCAKCGAHLGHIFPDGPEPTGVRYCLNSASLDFEEKG